MEYYYVTAWAVGLQFPAGLGQKSSLASNKVLTIKYLYNISKKYSKTDYVVIRAVVICVLLKKIKFIRASKVRN